MDIQNEISKPEYFKIALEEQEFIVQQTSIDSEKICCVTKQSCNVLDLKYANKSVKEKQFSWVLIKWKPSGTYH